MRNFRLFVILSHDYRDCDQDPLMSRHLPNEHRYGNWLGTAPIRFNPNLIVYTPGVINEEILSANDGVGDCSGAPVANDDGDE